MSDKITEHLSLLPNAVRAVDPAIIGSGSFGFVYKTTYKGSPVAVKTPLSGDEEKDLLHEINILSRLSHPNIATYVSCYHSPLCLIMELGEEDLSSLLFDLQRDLDWARRLKIAVQVAQALEYLHSQNPPILYRDLKPRNIVLRRDGSVFLVDFGLAIPADADDAKKEGIGTVSYTAPETPSDIYSFGVLLFELLTRIPAWKGCNQFAIRAAVRDGNRPLLPTFIQCEAIRGCPLEFRRLMEACWSQDPAARPDWKSILNTLGIMSTQIPIPIHYPSFPLLYFPGRAFYQDSSFWLQEHHQRENDRIFISWKGRLQMFRDLLTEMESHSFTTVDEETSIKAEIKLKTMPNLAVYMRSLLSSSSSSSSYASFPNCHECKLLSHVPGGFRELIRLCENGLFANALAWINWMEQRIDFCLDDVVPSPTRVEMRFLSDKEKIDHDMYFATHCMACCGCASSGIRGSHPHGVVSSEHHSMLAPGVVRLARADLSWMFDSRRCGTWQSVGGVND